MDVLLDTFDDVVLLVVESATEVLVDDGGGVAAITHEKNAIGRQILRLFGRFLSADDVVDVDAIRLW